MVLINYVYYVNMKILKITQMSGSAESKTIHKSKRQVENTRGWLSDQRTFELLKTESQNRLENKRISNELNL